MHFNNETFDFLRDLAANNERPWFEANKARYETWYRDAALEFIRAMAPQLAKVSPDYSANDAKSGGSLMRIYRDTRFSKDKTPYKTNIGINFSRQGAGVHSAGFYVHIALDEVFVGAGVWRPEPAFLAAIRQKIQTEPDRWLAILAAKPLKRNFVAYGESLSRVPKGMDPTHPCAEDLKRKDFIQTSAFSMQEATTPGFDALAGKRLAMATDYCDFLNEAEDAAG